jgi:hypothetical protein
MANGKLERAIQDVGIWGLSQLLLGHGMSTRVPSATSVERVACPDLYVVTMETTRVGSSHSYQSVN